MGEHRYKVLVIEDDEHDLVFLKAVLEGFPGDFVYAAHGEDGVKAFKDGQFDAVLLDLGLPDIDGIELIVKLHHMNPASLITVISGNDDPRITQQAIQVGATQVFNKPYTDQDRRILLNQLDVKRAAFLQGEKAKRRKNQMWIACAAVGSSLFVSSIMMFNAPGVPKIFCGVVMAAALAMAHVGIWNGVTGNVKQHVEKYVRKMKGEQD